MSHKLKTARTRVETGGNSSFEGASILDSVHAVDSAELKGSELICESPLCDVRFPQTGLEIEPRRFCCGKCRQQASLIRRVAKLLEQLSDDEALRILRGAK
jgi:hypothetical protein